MVDTRRAYDDLSSIYTPIMLGVVGLVLVLVVFAAIRFRDRGDGRRPWRRREAPLVEGLYALVLAVVAAVLVTITFRTETGVDRTSEPAGLEVRATAANWRWRFDYPRYGVSEIGGTDTLPTLLVPTNTNVRFSLVSVDVIHAFWVEELRFKRDAYPERPTTFDLVFSRPGRYTGHCAQFCGLRHSYMNFNVEALEPAAFQRAMRERGSRPPA
ncbi:MAG: cytochrome c oxidase subunit II [Thermoleophilaceae bacterium]